MMKPFWILFVQSLESFSFRRFPFQVAVISVDQPTGALEGWTWLQISHLKEVHQTLEHYLEDHPMTIVLSERNHGDRCCPQDLGSGTPGPKWPKIMASKWG